MKYTNGLAFSTIALAILTTGCVKKPENGGEVAYDNSQVQGVYDNTTYDTATTSTTTTSTAPQTDTTYDQQNTITYDNTAVTSSGTIYTGAATDNTHITTTNTYGQSVASAGDISYGQPAASDNGAFNNPYASSNNYPDPYGGSQSSNNTYSSAPASSNSAPASSNTGGGGIQLQIAALGDYYAAKEFKNSLSLEPGLSAYVKKGNPNKVIVSGIKSQSDVQRLKTSRFPGAFVVSGGSSYSSSSYGNNSEYTTNSSYGSSASTGSTNGIGVQIGAFSSHSKAQHAAESASSKYSPFVKTAKSNGKTLYKAILTGFASESAARSFIANRGSGFLLHGL